MLQKQKRVAINLIWMGLIFYAINFGFNAYLARHLPGGLYGDFRVGLNTLSLVGILLMLGTTVSSRKYLSGVLPQHNIEKASRYIGWNFRLVLISSTIFLLLILSVIFVVHGKDMGELANYHLAIQMLIFAPLSGLFALLTIYFQINLNLYRFGFLSQAAIYMAMAILSIIAVEFLGIVLTKTVLLWIVFITLLVLVSGVFLGLYLEVTPVIKAGLMRILKRDGGMRQEHWLAYSLKVLLIQLVVVLAMIIDLYMLEWLAPTEVAVDQYAAILIIVSVCGVITKNVYNGLVPEIAYELDAHATVDLQKRFTQCFWLNTAFLSVVALVFVFFGKFILSRFGHRYTFDPVYISLLILLLGKIFDGLRKPATQLSIFAGGEKRALMINITQLIGLVSLCFWLIPHWGIIGAAMSYTLMSLFATIFVYRVVRQRVPDINPWLGG